MITVYLLFSVWCFGEKGKVDLCHSGNPQMFKTQKECDKAFYSNKFIENGFCVKRKVRPIVPIA